jgi:hypothetical protein
VASLVLAGLTVTLTVAAVGRLAVPDAVDAGRAPGHCQLTYRVTSDNGSSFAGTLEVRNAGQAPLPDGTIAFDLAADQRLTATPPAVTSRTGRHVVVSTAMAQLTPGARTQLVFSGTYRNANPMPSQASVQGTPCDTTFIGASQPVASATAAPPTHAGTTGAGQPAGAAPGPAAPDGNGHSDKGGHGKGKPKPTNKSKH